MLVVDRSNCMLYELYRAFYVPRGAPPLERRLGGQMEPALERAAAGLLDLCRRRRPAHLPGLARYDEAAVGRIDHAIRVTFDSTRNAWVHPGSHCAGDTLRTRPRRRWGCACGCSPATSLAGFTGTARAIAIALKRFGLIVADNGSNWYLSGTSDRRWNNQNLDQLKRIPGSAFQVVKSAAPIHAC